MDAETKRMRFKKQYDTKDWSKLTANAEFIAAWDSNDLEKAGALAPEILYGGIARNKQEAQRMRADYKTEKLFEKFDND